MGLSCLLLTSDAALLELLRTAFSAAGVGIELRSDAASALELANRRHIDGFVIDCDGVPGAGNVLTQVRSSRSNRNSVVFAVLNGTTSVSAAVEAGANFVMGKPVQEKLLRGLLETALPRMEREHRRYFRHKVDLAIELSCSSGETLTAKMMNVSEGGLAVTHFGPAVVEGTVAVEFGLPGTSAQIFQAKAEVVWRDAFTIGLRFLRIEPACRLSFGAWLDSLEAQLQFRESTH
jgi:ActR/RegA family two-component response regulator